MHILQASRCPLNVAKNVPIRNLSQKKQQKFIKVALPFVATSTVVSTFYILTTSGNLCRQMEQRWDISRHLKWIFIKPIFRLDTPIISHVVEIESRDQLAEMIQTEKRVVCVEYTATWCRPCQSIKPHIDELSAIYKDKMVIAKVDVDRFFKLSEEAGVRNVPSFKFYLDQKVIHTFQGSQMNKIQHAVDTATYGL